MSLEEWNVSFRRRDDNDPRQFTVALHFSSLDFEYSLDYQDSISNKLLLERNNAPGGGKVEDEAVIVYSSLRDERGYPYLRFNFATNEHDPDLDEMVNIEFVAKRTETEGTRPLGLSKNEKLRLGYPVWDDGTFEPEEMEDHVAGMSADDLNRQIQKHTDAVFKIYSRLIAMKKTVDNHVKNATIGLQLAMDQARRTGSSPTATGGQLAVDRNASPAPVRRRKSGLVDDVDDAAPTSPKRRKGGPESTPISMEQDGTGPRPGPRPGPRSAGGGRGGRRKKPEGSGRKRKSMRKSI